jgi:hypothetical protein
MGTEIQMDNSEFSAGASQNEIGYVVLAIGDTVHYLRPAIARALASGLIASADQADIMYDQLRGAAHD